MKRKIIRKTELLGKANDLDDIPPIFEDLDNPNNIIDFCENLINRFNCKTDESSIIKSYQQFLNIGADNNNNSQLLAQVKEAIKKCSDKYKTKCIFHFFSIFVRNFLDQQIISSKMKEKLKIFFKTQNITAYEVANIEDINDLNASFKLVFDENAHFYFQKTYNYEIFSHHHKIIDDELQIYYTDFSNDKYHSFVVHSNKNHENNIILVPYFQFHDLEFFIQKVKKEELKERFSVIDKIVMIKEIAIGLSELHDHFIYHNNLSHKHIFIDNNKNAYIGSFAHSVELESNTTKQDASSYYRHPDLIQNPIDLSIESETNEDKARYDIYSFGVLMYEIITTKSPTEQFGNTTQKDRIDQLQNDFCGFLFNDEEDFDAKYGVQGMRDIISRCMSTDREIQYSTFEEVIVNIDNLQVYRNNEEEIETRIKESEDCNTYECELSDIVINFYFGNEYSKNTIIKFIDNCKAIGINKSVKITSKDPLTQILQLLNSVSLRKRLIQAPSHFYEPIAFIEDFYELFEKIKKYTDFHPLIAAYKSFLKENKENDYSILKTKVAKKISLFKQDRQYQIIYQLFSLIIHNLIDQEKIKQKFQENQVDENYIEESFTSSVFHDIDYIQNIGDFNATFKSCFDNDCKFYFKKTFNSNNLTSIIRQELIDLELAIYKKEFRTEEYGSFIIHSTNQIGNNQIMIPYFPFLNLRVFLSNINNKDNFATIDKLVIIKEIAIGFSELHSDHIYHLNISSSDIFIDNNKNAYIANFVHDTEYEQHQTRFVQSAYYRHPDLIQKPIDLSIEVETDENKARYDIYSFGVLMYEIITTKSPTEQFGNTTQKDRIDQLQNDFCGFLFNDEEDFDAKYGVQGMRDIISRCMSTDREIQYSTFEEVIVNIDNLQVYRNNEEEIETRIKESEDCNTYECELSDIVINFYFGNEYSKNTIIKFIDNCKAIGINKSVKITSKDPLTQILQLLNSVSLRKRLIQAPSHFYEPIAFIEDFYELFEKIKKYTDFHPLIAAYKSFLKENKENDYSILKTKVAKKISLFKQDRQYQIIYQLFSLIIHNLIDQEKIKQKFQENQVDENYIEESFTSSVFHDIDYIQNIGDFNATFKSCFDNDCKFYFKKTFNSNNLTSIIRQELIDLELAIYKKEFRTEEYGSFIIHSTNQIGNNQIMIPYFPFLNLRVFLSNIKNNKDEDKDKYKGKDKDELSIEFKTIDKIVMIKEIAIGFLELHSKYIYHQNINSFDIFIDNKKNAYIGNFAHDTQLEQHQTKLVCSAYYRHPDLIQRPNQLSMEEETDENKARYDIYSFGVLMYEIITTKSPTEQFGNTTQKDRIDQLQNDFCGFLFNDEEDFDAKYGVQGMRDIISRCMSTDREIQYSTFEEVIVNIDNLQVYRNNEEEIETRIKESEDCNTYECELSDIVINFYFGNKSAKSAIQKFIKTCQKIGISENIEIPPIKKDSITPILQFFDFKNGDVNFTNKILFFEERFNKMIELNAIGMNTGSIGSLSDNEKELMKLSMFDNNGLNKNDEDFYNCSEVMIKFNSNIIPITNLDEFEREETKYFCDHLLIYLFFISREISSIYSLNLYHGELSINSIGIYYNNITETFLPLIIPFYFFFKNSPNPIKTSTTRLKDSSNIEKYQRKDMKKFKEMMKKFDRNKIIPSEIYEIETMNEIVYKIYNLNIHNQNKEIKSKFQKNYENFLHYEYSSFKITFPIIYDIFVCKEKTNEIYQIFDTHLRIGSTVSDILRFSNFVISESGDNEADDESLNIIEIKEKLIKIKENNERMFAEIATIENEEKDSDVTYEFREEPMKRIVFTMKKKISHYKTENRKERYNHNPGFLQEDFSQIMKFESDRRVARIDNKLVYRTLEISTNIKIYSFRLIITRYIYGLNPLCKYRINVKIHQSKNKNIETVSHKDAMSFIEKLGYYPEQNSLNDIIFFVSLNYQPVKPSEIYRW